MSKYKGEEEFLRDHSRMVYNLALRLTGSQTEAEDLAQDALIRALKALPTFRGDSAHGTWVYRITVNTWKNRVRSQKRRGFWKMLPLDLFASSEDEEGPREERIPAKDPPLDAGLETEETAREVQKALMTLDEDSRAVVVLRDLKGLSYEEIAESLHLPVGTVKSKLSRARGALKEKLADFVKTRE